MKVKLWDNDCIGKHPEQFLLFHGDVDGDKTHINSVYNKDCMNKCQLWSIPKLVKFENGRDLFSRVFDTNVIATEENKTRAKFIDCTTLSAKQLKDCGHNLIFSKYSRNKQEHVDRIGSRFNTDETENSYASESIRGMEDVCRQQLSQGALGDVTSGKNISVMLS